MFSNFKYGTPQNEIGEVVAVIAGSGANETIANTQGKFVLTDRFYNIADYPDLYARIGSIGAAQFTPRTSGTTSILYAATYGNGTYLVGGFGGALRSSTDGITWSSTTSPTTATIRVLLYGNGLFVMGEENGSTGTIRSSTDGITWTSRSSSLGIIGSGNYSEGIFMMGGGSGGVYTSTNGTSWTSTAISSPTPNLRPGSGTVLYANGKYLAYGSGAGRTSTDAINWTTITSGPTGGLGVYSIAYGNGIYILSTTNSGAYYTSTDGYTWTSPAAAIFFTSTYNNGLFVIGASGGGGGAIATSTDGINWKGIHSSATTTVRYITYAKDKFVYVGDSGMLGTSANANTPEYTTLYDITTQFYVPAYTTGSRFYTLPTYGGNSAPRFVNYVRAK